MFDDAGEYIFHSRLDPRILIRLFPDLAGKLIRESDAVNVFAGMERDLRPGETISDISESFFTFLPSFSRSFFVFSFNFETSIAATLRLTSSHLNSPNSQLTPIHSPMF